MGFSPEEYRRGSSSLLITWQPATPVIVKKERFRCDSCKRFMSPLEIMVSQSGEHCHLTKKCLLKFAKKHHWEHLKFEKMQLITSEGEI